MLIVRRRRGESITIGDDIEIEILDISPTQVKVGIRAPKEVSVLRKEILTARAANLAASQGASPEALESFVEKLRVIDNALSVETSVPELDPKTHSAHSLG